ncbi:hypothetical protein CASFOL_014409 [Castilleja foliolosa]|uniref:Uncharacterized protein n=1 Tax=Castilleja foliolosa TaxID=1961234 RepID=A0ABD3C0Y8_9LAMI
MPPLKLLSQQTIRRIESGLVVEDWNSYIFPENRGRIIATLDTCRLHQASIRRRRRRRRHDRSFSLYL